MGMNSELHHQFATATERALFLMLGHQFLGNQNKDDYWEGYEPLRSWMCEQRDAAGFSAKDIKRITGTQMAGHWFGKSQFQIIGRDHYDKLREEAGGEAFCEPYADLMSRFSNGDEHKQELAADMRESRTHFNNTHDNMTDVWEFPRVTGDDRHGHATPKPVAMIARAILSSCPDGGSLVDPFLGSGTTLIAAEQLGRTCYGCEISPQYVDVIIRRWQTLTGEAATLAGSTETFADHENKQDKPSKK